MRRLVFVSAGLAAALAGEPGLGQQPTTRPAVVATAPAAETYEMRVKRVLSALEKAGDEHKAIRAEMTYEVVNRALGEKEARAGWVAYQRGDDEAPPRFRIHFDTLRLDRNKPIAEQLDYLFDGEVFSIARHRIKQLARYKIDPKQVRRPLRLGEGPFPLPFGQKTEDVLRYFHAMTRPADTEADEPENTDYVRLLPRDKYRERLNVRRIELWVDRETHLPVKIISTAPNRSVTTVTFEDLQTNESVKPSVFRFDRPLGWQETTQGLEEGQDLAP
jgi:hypothetical protein